MARSGAAADDLTSCKRDAKLENFLRQKLGGSVFERIRAYEACIAQSKRVKRNYKFAVLTDERVYITDNPPKVIREEESVFLGDVTSVQLVNEFPEFLSGEVRENSQHICVKYRALVPVARSKNLLNRLRQERRNGAEAAPARSDDGSSAGSGSRTGSPSLQLTTPRGSSGDLDEGQQRASAENGKAALLRLNRSFDESDLRALHRQMLNGGGGGEADERDSDRLSLSLPSADLKRLAEASSPSTADSRSDESPSSPGGTSSSSASASGRDKVAETCRPLPQRPLSNPGETVRNIDTPDTLSTHLALTLALPDQKARKEAPAPHRTLPTPDPTTDRRRAEPFQFPKSAKSKAPKETVLRDRNGNVKERLKVTKSRSLDSGSTQSSGSLEESLPEEERKEEVVEELHLYLLSVSSPFLMHLRSSWNNYIVRSTLLKDPKMAGRMGTRSSSKHRVPSREVLERQFQQLKSEITNSAQSMPDMFQLVQELCNAAEKYFVLKKLFWKSEDLFEFLIAQLGRFLPKSQLNLQNNDRGRHHRADELELAILLIESLGLMFRETEMVPGRLSTVKANNGKAVLDLLVVLTCLPEVPQRWRPPKTKAHSLLLETDADSWETYGDAEVFNLVKELTDASTAVLFELILIAHQANWGNTEGRFFNISWLVKVLESLCTTTFKFVERLISRAMRLLMPSSSETLTPAQAVVLFQQFFVLQTLIQYSSSIAAHVRNNYTEEFRYYVRSPHIVNKLPSDYPITGITLQIISEVISHVLQERTVLQPSNK